MSLKEKISLHFVLLHVCLFIGSVTAINAQHKPSPISNPAYIQSYDTMITPRIYVSQKYLALRIKDKDSSHVLKYNPNSKLNIGIGVTYGWLTINLAIAPGFMNNSSKEVEKGETKALDLQAHFYGPKLTGDFFLQRYKGYYLYPEGSGVTNKNEWYQRPDITMVQFGVAGYYVFNWSKFSYRAAYLQNEWQIKSAGSFLVGGQILYDEANADSALVPGVYKNAYKAGDIYRLNSGDIAPGGGYTYTLVLAKHFFINASLLGGLSVNVLKETSYLGSETKFAFNPNYAFKGAVGYNSRKLSISATWANNSTVAAGHSATYTYHSGNVRFHIAYRFVTRPKFKQKMKMFEGSLF